MSTATTSKTVEQYDQFLVRNYGPAPLTAVRGEGVHLWDDAGRRYLDFGAGIAVCALGHGHPHWLARVREQAGQLVHCSNLYRIPGQGRLAERLVARAGPGRVLFCNSGAEANESLLKLARLHGRGLAGEEGKRFVVLTAHNAFHGRTFGGMAATPQEKIQGGFRPMLEGFAHAPLNDAEAFARLVDERTCAIFLEPVQGEGGIHVADTGFLREMRALCDEKELLLLIDEVQCGIGRSGRFFAYEHAGITPDAIGMAKGLGGGFPIGAIWVARAHAELFTAGSHGTTFGGNPLASAAANAVLDVIEEEDLLARVHASGELLGRELQRLARTYPDLIAEARGIGLMRALELKVECRPVLAALRERGLLLVPAGSHVARYLPPLTVGEDAIAEAIALTEAVLRETRPAQS